MSFNKVKEFAMIEDKLNEIRKMCNRLQIPFIWVAAIKDDGQSTEYKVAIDENNGSELDPVAYPCHALIPGSMGISLQDDKIRDIVKVLNGFRVVSSSDQIRVDPDDFSFAKIFPEANSSYQYDQDSEGYVITEENNEEESDSSQEPTLYVTLSDTLEDPNMLIEEEE